MQLNKTKKKFNYFYYFYFLIFFFSLVLAGTEESFCGIWKKLGKASNVFCINLPYQQTNRLLYQQTSLTHLMSHVSIHPKTIGRIWIRNCFCQFLIYRCEKFFNSEVLDRAQNSIHVKKSLNFSQNRIGYCRKVVLNLRSYKRLRIFLNDC